MEKPVNIKPYLDGEGRVTQLPARQRQRRAVLDYLIAKFEPDTVYTEKQINAICEQWHTFGDYFLLRREMVDCGLLDRTRDGSRYTRRAQETTGQA